MENEINPNIILNWLFLTSVWNVFYLSNEQEGHNN